MSKLLINEHPLIVLPSLVEHFGGNYTKAILIQQIHWMVGLPNSGVAHNGHRWVWKTAEEWSSDVLPWLKPASIAKTLRDLEAENFIESTSRIRDRWDTTKYYRINYQMLEQFNTKNNDTHTSVDSNAHRQVDLNAHTDMDSNVDCIYTKTTAENTAENTTKTSGDSSDSVTLAEVNTAYQNNIGLFTQVLAEKVADAYDEFGGQWIIDAIGIACTQNVRKWAYIDGILKKWAVTGKADKLKPTQEIIDFTKAAEAIEWLQQ